eukprot:scaffold3574_cov121-Isochrysis_galbana.AAC.10
MLHTLAMFNCAVSERSRRIPPNASSGRAGGGNGGEGGGGGGVAPGGNGGGSQPSDAIELKIACQLPCRPLPPSSSRQSSRT